MRLITFILLSFVFILVPALAQNRAAIREYRKAWTTYSYSDPNPIPTMSRIYPYYRFDHYTDKPVQQEWKVVELENDYIKVVILPEIGGKIWTAIEKSTGHPFIYNNQVIKFRDIAMRGPWTSGGIEANYGIIGHTPNCATPVDYLTRTNPDGSVSCIIGVLDLLTRTPWRLEIKLGPNDAYFTTSSFWFNATPLEQPYYTWMNVGIKAKGNLQFVFPGTNALGHGGEVSSWPIQPGTGRDLSLYEQNNFGSYKSYHVFGQHTDFYGAYWHDDDLGMGHYSPRDDKPGKKIWIWGLSPQGMIWEKLLTDTDGQYVEVQSGRLFNQAAEQSTNTPFKHRGFGPYTTDTWTEYWFPVKGTKGIVAANNYGSLNFKRESGSWTLYFCPVQPIDDTIEVFQGEQLIYSSRLHVKPMQLFTASIKPSSASPSFQVRLGGTKLTYQSEPKAEALSRPQQMPAEFDWKSAYGLWLKGKEHLRQRQYREARKFLEECLKKDLNYGPALVDLAQLEYRSMNYEQAVVLTRRALSIDTYDPAANFYFGLSSLAIGRTVDAKDGFEIASQSTEYRSPAFTELSEIHFREKNYSRAHDYASKALDFNRHNLEALQVLALIERAKGSRIRAFETLDRIQEIDPLCHFVRMERSLWEETAASRAAVKALVRNEMPHETYLELAVWYSKLGLITDSVQVLELAPANPEISYWKAYLRDQLKEPGVEAELRTANSLSPRLVFPFRSETAAVLKWVIARDKSWEARYYLALIEANAGNESKALELLQSCKGESEFAPLYSLRWQLARKLKGDSAKIDDAVTAADLEPGDWRNIKLLVDIYSEKQRSREDLAYRLAQRYYRYLPDSYQLGAAYARTLILTKRYQEAGDLLTSLVLLPYEGSNEGRLLYKEAKLMHAIEKMRANDFAGARKLISEARIWPENLGAGKPYPEDLDEVVEDWLEANCLEKLGQSEESRKVLARLAETSRKPSFADKALSVMALQKLGRKKEAEKVIGDWKGDSAVKDWLTEVLQTGTGGDLELDNLEYRLIREWMRR